MVNLSRLPIPCVGKIVNVQDSLCEKLFLFPPFVSISFENNEQMKRGYFFSIQQNIMLMTNREIILRMSVPEVGQIVWARSRKVKTQNGHRNGNQNPAWSKFIYATSIKLDLFSNSNRKELWLLFVSFSGLRLTFRILISISTLNLKDLGPGCAINSNEYKKRKIEE